MENNNIVFLLGAGASVKAGVPDTYSFVNDFVNSIDEPEKKKLLSDIVNILKVWKKDDVDIELLIETMIKLDNKENEPLVQFYKGSGCIIDKIDELKSLIIDVKDFIKTKSIVKEEDILYYQPLLNFIKEYKEQDIVTLNYDICLEQFCNRHRLEFTDGFDVFWNPDNFSNEKYLVRLYKLHGSIMWYRSETGRYLKLPVMTKESKVDLITGEEAINLMMYPMQKMDYPEPLLELLIQTKSLLVTKCKILVIVGYSFRDESIKRLVLDAASKNRDLYVIMIDKNARNIYENKLKYYDEKKQIPTPLKGKVICLPYKFEKVFPYIKNQFIKYFNECINEEQRCIEAEIKGEPIDWFNVIKLASDAEYTDKILDTEENHPYINRSELQLLADITFKQSINDIANKDEFIGADHLTEYCRLLFSLSDLDPNISSLNQPNITFVTHLVKSGVGSYSSNEVKTVVDLIDSHINYATIRRDMMFEKNDYIEMIIKLLRTLQRELRKYAKPFEIKWYLFQLKTNIPSLDDIVKIPDSGVLQILDLDTLNHLISNYENAKIEKIFNTFGYSFDE